MPTYDYLCDACNHEFELFQSITEAKKKKCPKCGKNKLRRLFGTGAAIMFKGSGFYTTDYRSDSYKKKADADKPSSSDSGKGDSSKSESSKSESKSETKSESKSESKPETKKSSGKDKKK